MSVKTENFDKFKGIAGITILLALIIAFVNLLSAENATMQIHDVASKTINSKIIR